MKRLIKGRLLASPSSFFSSCTSKRFFTAPATEEKKADSAPKPIKTSTRLTEGDKQKLIVNVPELKKWIPRLYADTEYVVQRREWKKKVCLSFLSFLSFHSFRIPVASSHSCLSLNSCETLVSSILQNGRVPRHSRMNTNTEQNKQNW
jgi:hypothetical protein